MRLPFFAMLVLAFSVVSLPLHAAGEVKKLGLFGKWQAYAYKEKNHPVCYMMLRPSRSEVRRLPAKAKAREAKTVAAKLDAVPRGDAYVMVTLRPSEMLDPVVSYRGGYLFKVNSEVLLRLGPKPIALFTEKDQAWARSAAVDIAATKALRKTSAMVAEGKSEKNTTILDRFDLTGGDQAYKAIAKACGVSS